ncbi:MAG: excinuclease ABC subunit UvrB [Candidatus Micrarchaeota archaeon]
MKFQLKAPFKISPGQKEAIDRILEGFGNKAKKGEGNNKNKWNEKGKGDGKSKWEDKKDNSSNKPQSTKQTLLGITGSGKTFVMANVIQELQKPTLIVAHNKTLAAQLYTELKEYFPNNRVEYFISFYDYYQPESYIPTTDTYIEKDSARNEEIERMRMHAVSSLISRNDVIVVASISCIYGLGNPNYFKELSIDLKKGMEMGRQTLLQALLAIQFERNDQALEGGKFRVRGDIVDVVPVYEKDILRIELADGKIKSIKELDSITLDVKNSLEETVIFPAEQYVVPEEMKKKGIAMIRNELEEVLPKMAPLEAQRLSQRVKYDLEMIEELGYCSGIENYTRHFDGRKVGEPPYVLLDYFPKDFLLIIDESHQTIPQSRAMYNGDYARKKNLVDFGFRLPCAFDNRPLKFEEFEKKMPDTLFVSATPAEYELQKSSQKVDLITRPTGLLDPVVELHPINGQMKHLMKAARETIENGNRVLVTTLTKKMAEDLTDYLVKEGFKVRYMHSDIDSLDRIELVRQLRIGDFDILVGINLLREGLDIPEVATICILDADKEGFLRDERSLIQTIGRAARNVDGKVHLYADVLTKSIKGAMEITARRRHEQIMYNKKHHITPKTIIKSVSQKEGTIKGIKHLGKTQLQRQIIDLEARMRKSAEELNFEEAIRIRDALTELKTAGERRELFKEKEKLLNDKKLKK